LSVYGSLSEYVLANYGPLAKYNFVFCDINYCTYQFYSKHFSRPSAGLYTPFVYVRVTSVIDQEVCFFPEAISTFLILPELYEPSNPSLPLPTFHYRCLKIEEINSPPLMWLNRYISTLPNAKVLVPSDDDDELINVWELSPNDIEMLELLIDIRNNISSSYVPSNIDFNSLSLISQLLFTEITILTNGYDEASEYLKQVASYCINSNLILYKLYWLKLGVDLANLTLGS